ncbi:MAG: tryptophan-rich sensory protein [Ignavibacteriae bacterium]|nr:tryptophan-rich sensory protein [Ignavibacteriota bacterium]
MCQVAGIIGSLFTVSSIPIWYATLNKPAFNPPNWIFAPVWISLYILMGISFYLIWIKSDVQNFGFLLSVFLLQLVLNAFWTIIFFGLKSPLFAFIEIVVLWLVILFCIILFYRVSKISSYLLIPYLLWVSFAAVLNFSLWKLN